MKPIFVFSLPRTGSTMLQRILAAHADVASAPEPSILLPCLYATRSDGIYTAYGHMSVHRYIDRFCHGLPNEMDDYFGAVREFAMTLYRRAAGGDVRYFLDKTPGYSHVVDKVIRAFPDGKFIFLWRHPLAVVSSMIRTFGEGKWRVFQLNAPLHDGLVNLVAAWEKYSDRSCAVRYEDIVAHPESELARLTDYLELPFDRDMLTKFTSSWPQGLRGLRAHADGARFDSVSQEPLTKWQQTLRNPLRKAWCRRYLRWIGRERLATMGYDQDRLLRELATLPFSVSRLGSDAVRMLRGTALSVLELKIIGPKLARPSEWHRMAPHS